MDQQGAGEYAVTWLVDEIEVGASLTRPAGDGPFPAVIMVAGSGPTDRNWNTPLLPGTNGSAALLAQVLADNGFIVLRYDKRAPDRRGWRMPSGWPAKSACRATWTSWRAASGCWQHAMDVDATRLFALSNSEGAIHVLNYQVQQGALQRDRQEALPLAGMVLTGAPARPVGLVAHDQLAAQLQPLPGGAEQLAAYDRAMANFVAQRPLDLDPNLMEGVRNLILSITQPFNQPFARELWILDPLAQLAKVTVPVLVVIGKKDLQVDWQADGSLFAALAETQRNLEVAFVPDANHVLKHEARPRETLTGAEAAASYNVDGTVLDPEAVGIIVDWLRKVRSGL